MTRKAELCSMTWKEVEEAFARNPVILLPMGSIEQHGPQTPTGDYRYTAEISRRIAERTAALSAPTIPWGYSEYFKGFPGCLTLQPETLRSILLDTLDGFLRFDLDHFVFVCGHKGNMPILEQTGRWIKDEYGLRVATIEPLSWLTNGLLNEFYGTKDVATGHGSDPMTSLAMYLFPDDVRLDLAEKGNPSAFQGRTLTGMSQLNFEGSPVHMYFDTDEITSNGVFGDVSKASAAVGEKCVEHMVDIGSRFVTWFATLSTRIDE